MDTWQMIKSERTSTAEGIAALPAGDWDRSSLCEQWTVRDVVAHMIDTATVTPPTFFGRFIASGFNFGAMVRKNIAAIQDGRTDRELVELLRSRTGARTAPPGPSLSWLGETIVHGEDVFRAVGDYRDHPEQHLVAVADFYKNSNTLIGTKKRIEGVALTATDAGWKHGSGPEVRGPMIALLLAMTGRKAVLDDLTGEGVEVLRSRG